MKDNVNYIFRFYKIFIKCYSIIKKFMLHLSFDMFLFKKKNFDILRIRYEHQILMRYER